MSEQVNGQSKAWRDAIAACVREYDTNEKLRAVLERSDACYLLTHAGAGHPALIAMPNKPDGFVDPVSGIHPPKMIIKMLQDSFKSRSDALHQANEREKAARIAANNADSPYERQQALEAIKWETPEWHAAWDKMQSTLSTAGVYALSLRSPFFVFEDTSRKSRSVDENEKALFAQAQSLIRDFPSHTRRMLHDAKTKEEREEIIRQSRTECLAKLVRINDDERKAKEERAIRLKKAQPKTRLKPAFKQNAYTIQAHNFIETAWPKYIAKRKAVLLKPSRDGFVKHPNYKDGCERYGIKTGDDVRRIQDVIRKSKMSAESKTRL